MFAGAATTPAAQPKPVVAVKLAPTWGQLSPYERQVLAPLAAEWDKFSDLQRHNLVGVAKRYPTLSREEQARVQVRLTDWARLTPQQRDLARKNFQVINQLPPEQRKEVKRKLQQRKPPAVSTTPEPPPVETNPHEGEETVRSVSP